MKKKVNPVSEPDAKILLETPFISYPEIQLNENFEVYLSWVLRLKKAPRTEIKMTPYQLSFQINVGSQRLALNFVETNRQLAFLKLSLVYDKSDHHKTIYDSCNVEVGTQKVKSLKIGNASLTYVLTNEIKYDLYDAENAY